MITCRIARTQAPRRSVRYPVTVFATLALLATTSLAARLAWNGEPYPSADPDAVAERLKTRSNEVYDSFALAKKYAAQPSRVDTGACYHRGLSGYVNLDRARLDVSSFRLYWDVPNVPEPTARDALRQARQQLTSHGWEFSHDWADSTSSLLELGFRYEEPGRGDKVDLRWNSSTTTLFVEVYAPCTQVPDEFNAHDWPAADWLPKQQF